MCYEGKTQSGRKGSVPELMGHACMRGLPDLEGQWGGERLVRFTLLEKHEAGTCVPHRPLHDSKQEC
jgi:hypothetical protein